VLSNLEQNNTKQLHFTVASGVTAVLVNQTLESRIRITPEIWMFVPFSEFSSHGRTLSIT